MRRSRLAACLAGAALAAGACSSTPEVEVQPDATGAPIATDDAAEDATPSTEDATPDEAPDETAPTASGEPSTTPSPEPTPSTSAPAATAEPTPSGGGQPEAGSEGTVNPVPAGTYTYATTGFTKLGEEPRRDLPPRTTLEVTAAGGDDVQRQTRDTRDEDGYGSRNTTELRYGVEGAVLLRSTLESTVEVFGSPFTSVTELEADPPVVIGPNGGDVGFRTEIHLVGDDVVVDGTLTVTGREDVTVGGETVEAFVVEVQYVLSGSIEGTSRATWRVRPSDLLVLRDQSVTDVTSRGLRYQEEYDAQLEALTPR